MFAHTYPTASPHGAMSEDFEIKKEPVYGRDESGARLFGWTFGEMALVAGTLIGAQILFQSGKVSIAAAVLAYLYVKKVKGLLPERYIQNAYRFYSRKHFLYRAGARDTEWVPPIMPKKKKKSSSR